LFTLPGGSSGVL